MSSRTPVSTLTLASASPRRRGLLARLGLPFIVLPVDVDERLLPGEPPVEFAQRVALAKAEAAVPMTRGGFVLGADTIVVLNGAILGKPKDRQEALAMLDALRGRDHAVMTAVAIINASTGGTFSSVVTTRVWMRPYTDAEIAAYIDSGDPFDKAGAYAIQSPDFHPVARLEGCYNNVVGLPLCEVVNGLLAAGYPESALPIDGIEEICLHNLSA
ncbi:MAG: septum formation inhibitor Maf [Chloroflexi bacterium]|nr:septum formation inhibitor Maf [Chloroflexota bacterium]